MILSPLGVLGGICSFAHTVYEICPLQLPVLKNRSSVCYKYKSAQSQWLSVCYLYGAQGPVGC